MCDPYKRNVVNFCFILSIRFSLGHSAAGMRRLCPLLFCMALLEGKDVLLGIAELCLKTDVRLRAKLQQKETRGRERDTGERDNDVEDYI